MVTYALKLQIGEGLFQDAKLAGLLAPEAIEDMLRKEIKRRRVNKLFEFADRLAKVDLPVLSMAEVEAEITALRVS